MKLNELVVRATNGELTSEDLNAVVIALGEKEAEQDRKIKEHDIKVASHDRGFRTIEEEYPLLPPEADDLSNAVKRKGVDVLGGKKSNAYANKDLRQRVYRDIYGEVKREFGLINERGGQLSYKKLKRKYLNGAMIVVEQYIAPTVLSDEISSLNDLDGMDD